jgi:hypothetical protein
MTHRAIFISIIPQMRMTWMHLIEKKLFVLFFSFLSSYSFGEIKIKENKIKQNTELYHVQTSQVDYNVLQELVGRRILRHLVKREKMTVVFFFFFFFTYFSKFHFEN